MKIVVIILFLLICISPVSFSVASLHPAESTDSVASTSLGYGFLESDSATIRKNTVLEGRLKKGLLVKATFRAEKNSPLLIWFSQTDCLYTAAIINKSGQKLLLKTVDSTGYHAFTPPSTDEYVIEMTGLQGAGKYQVSLVQYTTDAELNSKENLLAEDSTASGRIAVNAVATYTFFGEQNSPLLLTFDREECSYVATIYENGRRKLASKEISTIGVYPFT